MDHSSGHRKIELQAPEDLTFLINNVRRAAAESINQAFPPVEGTEGQEDELRVQIEKEVNKYINQTFTQAAPNLSINGMPVHIAHFLSSSAVAAAAAEEEEHYEPFDGRKRERIEDLARQEEDLLRDIAALKRRAPAAAAAAYANAFSSGLAADEEALEATRAAVVARAAERRAGLELAALGRQAAVERAFADAVAGLGRLKKEMPATVAKMERARVAGEYVVAER